MAALRLACALVALGCWTGVQARIVDYVEDNAGSGEIALGYPPPIPASSVQAFAGFRDYDALLARLLGLDLASTQLSGEPVGLSHAGREIWAFTYSDPDTRTRNGTASEGAVLHSGGIHAREWQAPEAVVGIIERLAGNEADEGFHQFLLENLELRFIPVLNVDGFRQTQRYPVSTHIDVDIEQGNSAPRDGRQRRKNMRDTDEDLATTSDLLNGVDLNRNFDPFWAAASGTRSSANPGSIVYHGTGPASEAESRILLVQADALSDRLRLFIDTHSFGRVLFGNDTHNSRLNALSRSLAASMGRSASQPYGYAAAPVNQGIGATDEVFAYYYEVPSFTLEIEPSINGASEYGGHGVDHDGFILPEAQVPRMRAEIGDMALLAYYRQSGPPNVEAVAVLDADSGQTRFAAHWSTTSGTRRLIVDQAESLTADTDYLLWIAFNKPMRKRNARNQVVQYPGQTVALAPQIRLLGTQSELTVNSSANGWIADPQATPRGFLNYRDDSHLSSFRLSTDLAASDNLRLDIAVSDLSGLALDADPATPVNWNQGHWTGYQDEAGVDGDAGGSDGQIVLRGRAPAGDSPAVTGGGSGSLGQLLLLILAGCLRRRPAP